MTGYGKASCEVNGKKITVEVRSVNSKQLDLNLRMPSVYRDKEAEMRAVLSKQAERGKVDCFVNVEFTGETGPAGIDTKLAKNYYNELTSLAKELNINADNLLTNILRMPEVLRSDRSEPDEKEFKALLSCFEQAVKEFIKFREAEGAVLEKELQQRVGSIAKLLGEVKKLDEQRIPSVRERLQKSVAALKEEVDANRFEQELIYYIEKLDIAEEKLRLQTHCDYFIATMKEASSGRKLGFISQEIGREINTIGSKANDAPIQKLVVQMKDELEKVKEQLLNVL